MNTTVTTFRDLHRNTTPLCLPNAWDAASARLFASLGAPAIATTSAGVAWTLGYPDGRRLPVEEVVGAVARMVRMLKVPLSFDIENGYADEPTIVATTVKRLAQLGIAGINIEDGSDAPEVLAQKIRAIREALTLTGS